MSAEPELLDLAAMPIEQLSAMVTLLVQVQASARAIPIRPGTKAELIRTRSLELADGLTPEIERYNAEIGRRMAPPATDNTDRKQLGAARHLRLVVNNVKQART